MQMTYEDIKKLHKIRIKKLKKKRITLKKFRLAAISAQLKDTLLNASAKLTEGFKKISKKVTSINSSVFRNATFSRTNQDFNRNWDYWMFQAQQPEVEIDLPKERDVEEEKDVEINLSPSDFDHYNKPGVKKENDQKNNDEEDIDEKEIDGKSGKGINIDKDALKDIQKIFKGGYSHDDYHYNKPGVQKKSKKSDEDEKTSSIASELDIEQMKNNLETRSKDFEAQKNNKNSEDGRNLFGDVNISKVRGSLNKYRDEFEARTMKPLVDEEITAHKVNDEIDAHKENNERDEDLASKINEEINDKQKQQEKAELEAKKKELEELRKEKNYETFMNHDKNKGSNVRDESTIKSEISELEKQKSLLNFKEDPDAIMDLDDKIDSLFGELNKLDSAKEKIMAKEDQIIEKNGNEKNDDDRVINAIDAGYLRGVNEGLTFRINQITQQKITLDSELDQLIEQRLQNEEAIRTFEELSQPEVEIAPKTK